MSVKSSPTYQLSQGNRTWTLDRPQIMGIVNCTPDSFYRGNRFQEATAAVQQGLLMLSDGADILDVGGQSTRPGAIEVNPREEWQRIEPVLGGILENRPEALISIDTFHADVAQKALQAGAFMINDVYGGTRSTEMADVIREFDAPYALMHMQGTPQDMQKNPQYAAVVTDVKNWFVQRMDLLQEAGVNQIIVDVGIGFGKTIGQNFTLLRELNEFQSLERPMLIGISRKSLIWRSLNITSEEALNGTTALHAWTLANGANILRVHDVKAAAEVIQLHELLQTGK